MGFLKKWIMTCKKDYVVLLHGFWRTSRSMRKIEEVLLEEGYCVINLDYPSKKEKIENLSNNYLKKALEEKCPDQDRKIHFVTHSMGGIIVRYFLANNKLENLGRVVMLAPPNKGAKLADFCSKFSIANKISGPALKQLKTGQKGLPNVIPFPKYEVGIIAGKYDQKTPANYTRLKNMKDFLLVPRVHTYIMEADEVMMAVIKFLREGKF